MNDTKQDAQFLCTVCGQIGVVGRCCGLDTREPLNDRARNEILAEEQRKANSEPTTIHCEFEEGECWQRTGETKWRQHAHDARIADS